MYMPIYTHTYIYTYEHISLYTHRHNAHVYMHYLDNSMNLVKTIVEFCNIFDWFPDACGYALHRHLTHA